MEQRLLHGRLRRPTLRSTWLAAEGGRQFASSVFRHVARLDGSDPRAAIVRAIMALASSLRLEVVADGVETELQRRELEAMGWPLSQGYLFSRPLRAADDRAIVLQDLRR